MLLTFAISIGRIGPKDAAALNALAETDSLSNDDAAVAPSGAVTPDGARGLLAGPYSPLLAGWLAGWLRKAAQWCGSGVAVCECLRGRFLPEMRFR